MPANHRRRPIIGNPIDGKMTIPPNRPLRPESLARVPAKACPGLDPGWIPVRRQGHALVRWDRIGRRAAVLAGRLRLLPVAFVIVGPILEEARAEFFAIDPDALAAAGGISRGGEAHEGSAAIPPPQPAPGHEAWRRCRSVGHPAIHQ